MNINYPSIERCCAESEIYSELIDFDGKSIIELGCGDGAHARAIAERGVDRQILAFEVDQQQHAANLQSARQPNLEFRYGGAESIDLASDSYDVVMMFKSLHHVPLTALDQALNEVARVLRPGGLAYISEPIFAGEFNHVIRLFHDEQRVREAAFSAVTRSVDAGSFELVSQTFFLSPSHFTDFAQFEQRMINATHTEHRLDEATKEAVKQRFDQHMQADGAHFRNPMRVDLLRRPLAA